MAENIFQKIKRALPVKKELGWSGFFQYLKTSTSPQKQSAIGPTASEVLASDDRLRRRLQGQGTSSTTAAAQRGPARLTLPTLVGV